MQKVNIMNSYKKSIFLFETIKICDGIAQNLDFHILRAKSFTKGALGFDFGQVLNCKQKGIFRAKVIYSEDGEFVGVEYFPYEMRKFYEFKLVEINFDYSKKYLNRSQIERAKNGFSEIIMLKNSLITDTSIANLAIFDGKKWLTPKTPLLNGTTRARLLESGFLSQEDINVTMLLSAKKLGIMNAMMGFVELGEFKIY